MPRFMLLLHESTTGAADLAADEIQAIIARYSAWADKLKAEGRHAGGQKLADDGGGRHMVGSGAALRVTDGPFAEAKEVIGGYFAVHAADYAEACRIAASCPHLEYGGRIEVRQFDELATCATE